MLCSMNSSIADFQADSNFCSCGVVIEYLQACLMSTVYKLVFKRNGIGLEIKMTNLEDQFSS
jgi:hypothetical protein